MYTNCLCASVFYAHTLQINKTETSTAGCVLLKRVGVGYLNMLRYEESMEKYSTKLAASLGIEHTRNHLKSEQRDNL